MYNLIFSSLNTENTFILRIFVKFNSVESDEQKSSVGILSQYA